MRIYQFHFFDLRGGSPALDFAECVDDGAAAHSARDQLTRHATCKGVDVFEDDRLVLRLERPVSEIIRHGAAIHGAC